MYNWVKGREGAYSASRSPQPSFRPSTSCLEALTVKINHQPPLVTAQGDDGHSYTSSLLFSAVRREPCLHSRKRLDSVVQAVRVVSVCVHMLARA